MKKLNKISILLVLAVVLLNLSLVSSAKYDLITEWATTDSPYGIATDNTYIYIGDWAARYIYIYDMDGTDTTNYFDVSGTVSGIHALAYNDGKLYVLEQSTDTVWEFYSSNGTYTGFNIGVADCVTDGAGVTIDGTYMYVTDTTGNKICKYYLNGSIHSQGSTNETHQWVNAISNYGGKLYVEDSNKKIFVYDASDLSYIEQSATLENLTSGGLAIETNGSYFWITDYSTNKVLVYENTDADPMPYFNIALNTPENNTHIHGLVEFYNFTANISSSIGIENATIFVYNESTDLVYSETQIFSDNLTVFFRQEINVTSLSGDGDYTWKIEAWETNTNATNSSETFNFELHLEPPHIFWYSPAEQNVFTTASTYNLNVSTFDAFLDAVNVTVYNSSNDETYNNFSDFINTTTFDVFDVIPLENGLNTIEICVRDTLAGSPKIKDAVSLDKKSSNTYDEQFDIELDNGVIIRRTTYIIDDGKGKIRKADYNMESLDKWDKEGKHIKTDITMDKLQKENWGIRVDYECLEGCDSMIYLNDRNRDRIIDSGRNMYFQYDDAVAEGWNVKYEQNNKIASVYVTYPTKEYFNSKTGKHTIDPIAGGLNNVCESFNITVDIVFPEVTITYPLPTTYETQPNQITGTTTEDNCESIWYSVDEGATNTTIACVPSFTISGLSGSVVEGTNTWLVYVNDSAGNINSTGVEFTYTPDQFGQNLPNEIRGSGQIYEVMRSVGAGIYFMLFGTARGLGTFLIIFVIIGVISIIGYAIAKAIPTMIKNNTNQK